MKNRNQDPIEHQIEQALRPGEFVYDRDCISFVGDLEKVADDILKVLEAEPLRAVGLCEAYLAGCHAKADELDDSSGSFGQFAQDLICLWIKARQAGDADPDSTAATLLAWMDDDPCAFCHEIEKQAAAAFNRAGLTAFEARVRGRFEIAAAEEPRGYPFRHWSTVRRAVYLAQKNDAAYVELAERTDLTPEDCLALAKLFVTTKPEEALQWVDRGRALDREGRVRSAAAYDLDRLHRELLVKFGRGEEALQEVWAAFRDHPSKYSYQDLMKFMPETERSAWHEKAMDSARGSDLPTSLELHRDWVSSLSRRERGGLRWIAGLTPEWCAFTVLPGTPAPVVSRTASFAATAAAHGLAVVTRNRADFVHAGVRVVDPFLA